MAVLGEAGAGIVSQANNWEPVVFVGPEADPTPSAEPPTAHFADANSSTPTLRELGVVHDVLIVTHGLAAEPRQAYGEGLDAMLRSAGLRMCVSPRPTG